MGRFAQWLDITMSNRGIRGRTLARKLGVHDSAISRWRNGQGVPSLSTTMQLARVLDVDPIRLAVTAGHMSSEDVHVQPLALPPARARRENVRNQIESIKGLSTPSIERLLAAYDALEEEGSHE